MRQKFCFVIMPFREPLNEYYKNIISPAIESTGIQSIRSDEIFGTRAIIKDIINSIWNSKMLIAEMSLENLNVAYELGVAHAFGKPVILMTQDIDLIPFDLRHLRIIKYNTSLPNWEKTLMLKIAATIKQVSEEPQKYVVLENTLTLLNNSVRNALSLLYKEFEGLVASEEKVVVDEKGNCTITDYRNHTTHSDLSHIIFEVVNDKQGVVDFISAYDLDFKKEIEVLTNIEYNDGHSFFLIFPELKKKNSSFNYVFSFYAENYISNLIDNGVSYIRKTPLSKIRFERMTQEINFPDIPIYSNLSIQITRHPNKNMEHTFVNFEIVNDYKCFRINHGNISNSMTEIILEIKK